MTDGHRATGEHYLRGNDVPDFDLLWRSHREVLWRSLYAMAGGDSGLVEDALAEAFARAIAHQDRIRDVPAWIYRTASRVLTSELKNRSKSVPLDARDDSFDDTGFQESEDLRELIWALQRLSPNQRSVVVLRHEMGLSTLEVARYMGLQIPTVRVHLFRARRKLRELLDDRNEERWTDE
jgi:RNA polymerase sigma factor (sigma-70 family)